MNQMTPDGKKLITCENKEIVVIPGDRVMLRQGMSGIVHCWTKKGVMVVLDEQRDPIKYCGYTVAAFDCGDGDIIYKL